MIRDRIKGAARRVLLRAFGMERDAEASDGPPKADPTKSMESQRAFIPPIVQGSGDTPGPNHKTDIGRTWLSAQVISEAAPPLIDLRPPRECVAGMLPGAILLPEDQIFDDLQRLPPKTDRIVIYDQIGGERSDQVAAKLRELGWEAARRLVGGYAEWIEYDEPIQVPQPPAGARLGIGAPVQITGGAEDGQRGDVQEVRVPEVPGAGGQASYRIYLGTGKVTGWIAEDRLKG